MCPSNDSGCLGRRQPQPEDLFFTSSSSSSFPQSTDSGTTISQSETSPTFTPTSTTFFTSTTPLTSILFSTALSTSFPSLSTTTPLHSSSEPPSSSTPPTSLSSGFVFTTFTSSFVSNINGSPTTIVTPIVTAVRTSAGSLSSSHTSIIAGSVVAGTALLILALATLFCLQRRRRRRKRYWALSRAKRLPSRPTSALAGDEMDLPFPSPPFASLDHSNPFSTHSSSQRNSSATGSVGSDAGGSGSGGTGSGDADAPVYNRHSFSRSQSPSSYPRAHASLSAPLASAQPSTSSLTPPPRLLRARASESGSIFQESVWPPPSAASQLMDPLTYPSQSVDLTRVVTDVMGPPESGPLLLLQPDPFSQELGQGQEQEQGALNPRGEEGERRGASTPDNWSPRPELPSSPSSLPPPSPPRPPRLRPRPASESGSELDIPLRPPSTPWLSRPLNPSPRGSPLQHSLPL